MLKKLCLVLISSLSLLNCSNKATLLAPDNLSISEGFNNPIGFYNNTPTFSWQLPLDGKSTKQQGYRIVVASKPELLPNKADLWDSKKQDQEASAWIKYQGKQLNSRAKVYWQVMYWNQDKNASKWSATSHFELGLLNNKDWQAQWIGLPTKAEGVMGSQDNIIHRPQYLRKTFKANQDVVSARLYITAKGVFDVALNGKDVSNDVMPPGWTPYKKRIETITYNVTNLLQKGDNTIGVEVAAGWHSGRLGWMKSFWNDTESPKIICQLELTMSNGETKIVTSNSTWKGTTRGPIQLSEIYDGELYNANLEMVNWSANGFDDKSWVAVTSHPIDNNIKLKPKRHRTVKPKITLETKEVTVKKTGVIFDLKQNMVGVPLIKAPVKKGDTLTVRFAEMLSPDGSFYTKNYRSAHSTDYYIASKDGVINWQPKFTFHGFRYVELSGFDASKKPTKNWVTGIVQYSNFKKNGTFTSSHKKLNQLQSNIVWGLRSNFFDIPTDCPQRDERMGWTGDAQVFGPTSLFNADVYKFWASWLQSVRESQYQNGGVPWVVPDVLNNKKVSSGWGDVCTIIPWKIYFRTGDKKVLEDNFDMMKKWVAHHKASSKNYVSNMNTFADWLQPFPENGNNKGDTSHDLIGTAFFAYSAKLTAQTALVLNKKEEHKKYLDLYKNVANAFNKTFFNQDSQVINATATQTSYLLALAFDLLPESKRKKAGDHLIQKIKDANNHLRTGFLGTPLLSQVLDKMGRTDLIYTLLFNETYPSWFYSINQGATTIWERWNSYSKADGFNAQNMNSLNHYAYGAIGEWIYERVAGIAPLEPGYKKIRIAPKPDVRVGAASASLNTTYGHVSASWQIKDDFFNLDISIPVNTTAQVKIPITKNSNLYVNNKLFETNDNVRLDYKNKDVIVLDVKPGNYKFKTNF